MSKSRDELLAEAKRIKHERLLAKAKQVQAERIAADQAAAKTKPSAIESGFRGSVQGLTSGFGDEASGVLAGIVRGVSDTAENIYEAATTDKTYEEAAADDKGFLQNYRDVRDYARRRDALAQAANPKTYGAAEIGGGIAQAFVPGVGAATVAGKGAKAGEIATKAALTGGATGLGLSEADITKGEVTQALVDTAKGVGTGLVTAGGSRYISNKFDPNTVRQAAERRATKAAIGNQDKIYNELMAKGEVEKVGRDLLDTKTVQFGSKAESIAKRAAANRKSTGKEIGGLLEEADDAALGGRSKVVDKLDFPWKSKQPFDGAKVAAKIRTYADEIAAPNNEALIANLRRQADKFEKMGKVSLKEANRLKKSYKWKHGENQPLSQEATNKLKGIVGDEMEETVGQISRARSAVSEPAEQFAESAGTGTGPRLAGAGRVADGTPILKEATASAGDKADLLKRYQTLKGSYGSLDTAAKGARKLAGRQEKNRTFSLTDYMVGIGAGGATFNPLVGAAAATGNKVLRERGSSMAAVTLDRVSKALAKGGETLGPFAPVLAKAAKNGNLGAVHLLLMKSQPEYRELVRQQLKEKKGERK